MKKCLISVLFVFMSLSLVGESLAVGKTSLAQVNGHREEQVDSFSFPFDDNLSLSPDKSAEPQQSLIDKFALRGLLDATAGMDLKEDEANEHSYDFRNILKIEGVFDSDSRGASPGTPSEGVRWQLLTSFQGDYLWMGPGHDYSNLRMHLYECSLLWATNRYEIKLGKQIVRWGKTDQVSPVDNLNPQDLRQFILRDLEARKLPIWMLRGRAFVDSVTLEGIYIPWFEPDLVDYFNSDWATFRQVREDVKDSPLPLALKDYLLNRRVDESEPDRTFSSSEFGGRVTISMSGWDVGVSYLYTREDAPFFSSFPIKNLHLEGGYSAESLLRALDGAEFVDESIQVKYQRQQIVGAEFETTLGQIGLRGEAAYFDRVSFITNELTSVRRPVFHYVIGVDYSSPSEWYANLQWSHQIISGSDSQILYFKENDTALLAELNQTFWRGQFKVGIKANYDLTNGSFYLRPEAELKYFKNIELTFGAHIFEGGNGSLFGFYDHNDQLFLRMKYYF